MAIKCQGEDYLPDLGRRRQSNVRRAISRANRTDVEQDTENDNSRIGMSELCSRVIENEVDMLKIERVRVHQTQQQQSRHN